MYIDKSHSTALPVLNRVAVLSFYTIYQAALSILATIGYEEIIIFCFRSGVQLLDRDIPYGEAFRLPIRQV